MAYNDYADIARVILFDAEDSIIKNKTIGSDKVRGFQFDPIAWHLVALISGGMGQYPSNSSFVKLRVPSLDIIWSKPVGSSMVGMEQATVDNSDNIAIAEDRYVLHSTGNGMQSSLYFVLTATTGEQMENEQNNWVASQSYKQMCPYNEFVDGFLMVDMGAALTFTRWKGAHLGTDLQVSVAGSGQGFTPGAIKADPWGNGFAAVWSYGERDDDVDKLYFAMIDVSVNPAEIKFHTQPKMVSLARPLGRRSAATSRHEAEASGSSPTQKTRPTCSTAMGSPIQLGTTTGRSRRRSARIMPS